MYKLYFTKPKKVLFQRCSIDAIPLQSLGQGRLSLHWGFKGDGPPLKKQHPQSENYISSRVIKFTSIFLRKQNKDSHP